MERLTTYRNAKSPNSRIIGDPSIGGQSMIRLNLVWFGFR
jgi:hypothetical protein